MNDWKNVAKDLYFNKHLKINTIVGIVGISRQHISKCLCDDIRNKQEKEYRKAKTKEKQRKNKGYLAENMIVKEIILIIKLQQIQ